MSTKIFRVNTERGSGTNFKHVLVFNYTVADVELEKLSVEELTFLIEANVEQNTIRYVSTVVFPEIRKFVDGLFTKNPN